MGASKSLIIGQGLTGIANGVVKFVPGGIVNPRGGMMVDEIRFLVTMKPTVADPLTPFKTILHDACRFYCKVGKTELTSGYVGMSLAAGVRDWYVDCQIAHDDVDPGWHDSYGVGVFTWRLPKPMFLPENGVLDIGVKQQDDLSFPASLLNVDIAVLCREVPKGQEPKMVDVPYVMAWYGGALVNPGAQVFGSAGQPTVVVASAIQQSSTSDLRNTHRVSLKVTRFAATQWANGDFFLNTTNSYGKGAAAAGQQSGPEYNAWIGGAAPLLSPANNNIGNASAPYSPTSLQILDQHGQPIVRDQASPGAIFAYADRAWRVQATLPPNGYYLIDATPVITSPFKASRLAVAVIGYRTIPVAELGVA